MTNYRPNIPLDDVEVLTQILHVAQTMGGLLPEEKAVASYWEQKFHENALVIQARAIARGLAEDQPNRDSGGNSQENP